MNGSRRLTSIEITQVLSTLSPGRDRLLFTLGLATGFRISELLSLRVIDIQPTLLTVHKRNMKGKIRSRSVPISSHTFAALREHIQDLSLISSDPIFISRKGSSSPITRQQAALILRQAYKRAHVEGRVSSHSMRKTFANRVYEKLDRDLAATQKALGHVNINSTISYLNIDQDRITKVILEL